MRPRTALFLVLGCLGVASIYRSFHFALTGFFMPDEYAYAYYHLGDLTYQGRDFLNSANYVLFTAFSVGKNPDMLSIFMPVYFMLWMGIAVVSGYKTMKLLGHGDAAISRTLLLSLTIPVFLVFSVTVSSEPVGLAMTMLGIYFAVRFIKKGGLPFVALSSLSFIAANYTRADFQLFMYLGLLPIVYGALKRSGIRTTALAVVVFAIPVAIFSFYPYAVPSGPIAVVESVMFPAASAGLPSCYPNCQAALPNPGRVYFQSAPSPSYELSNFLYLVSAGLFLGFNPLIALLILTGLGFVLIRRRDDVASLWFGLLGLGVLLGVAFTASPGPFLGLTTVMRYSYDAIPCFFVLVPFVMPKLKFFRGLFVGSLLVCSAMIIVPYQVGIFQSSIGGSYPFTSPQAKFLSLDYRTPLAEMRDYFQAHPQNHYTVLAEDPISLDENVSDMWGFTPGTFGLKVSFEPYAYAQTHQGTFFVYLPPTYSGQDGGALLPMNHTLISMIDDVSPLFFEVKTW